MSKGRLLFRVERGHLVPYDRGVVEELRARSYRVGDVLSAELRKPRNPGFHRLAHVLGMLVATNIEGFEGFGPHETLKRLQLESGWGCTTMQVRPMSLGDTLVEAVEHYAGKHFADVLRALLPELPPIDVRIPESLSFESMDEAKFRKVIRGLSQHISDHYWPELSPEEIEEMAEVMPEVTE